MGRGTNLWMEGEEGGREGGSWETERVDSFFLGEEGRRRLLDDRFGYHLLRAVEFKNKVIGRETHIYV